MFEVDSLSLNDSSSSIFDVVFMVDIYVEEKDDLGFVRFSYRVKSMIWVYLWLFSCLNNILLDFIFKIISMKYNKLFILCIIGDFYIEVICLFF